MKQELSSGNTFLFNMVATLRRLTILLSLERGGFKQLLDHGKYLPGDQTDQTTERLLKAGSILGLFDCDADGRYSWSAAYEWANGANSSWEEFIAVVRHQVSYMNLVDNPAFWTKEALLPSTQLTDGPMGYAGFLQGVAASHKRHAKWLAQLSELKDCSTMADLGGGLGTYAVEWVNSSVTRRASILDLPGIRPFVEESLRGYDEQLSFVEADFSNAVPVTNTDFVLFANILHLIPNWIKLLELTARTAKPGCLIGVFEADPTPSHGVLFDLQVHLRSGRRTGLISPSNLPDALAACGLTNIRQITTVDPGDPFQREYALWLGFNAPLGSSEARVFDAEILA